MLLRHWVGEMEKFLALFGRIGWDKNEGITGGLTHISGENGNVAYFHT